MSKGDLIVNDGINDQRLNVGTDGQVLTANSLASLGVDWENLPVQVQSDWNETNSSAVDFIKNKPSIPGGQVQSDWTQTNSSSVDFIKNKPPARSQSSASRSLNNIFQVSTTRDSLVGYSVDIACSLSLTGGTTGTVFLEMATNSGFTTGVQELARCVNGNTGTLTIGLNITQNATAGVNGYVPAGNFVRLRTDNTVGTPTFTYRSGQEVLL